MALRSAVSSAFTGPSPSATVFTAAVDAQFHGGLAGCRSARRRDGGMWRGIRADRRTAGVAAASLADEQLERGVRGLELVAFVLELASLRLQDLARPRARPLCELDAEFLRACMQDVALAGQFGDEDTRRQLPTSARVDVLVAAARVSARR